MESNNGVQSSGCGRSESEGAVAGQRRGSGGSVGAVAGPRGQAQPGGDRGLSRPPRVSSETSRRAANGALGHSAAPPAPRETCARHTPSADYISRRPRGAGSAANETRQPRIGGAGRGQSGAGSYSGGSGARQQRRRGATGLRDRRTAPPRAQVLPRPVHGITQICGPGLAPRKSCG